MNEVIERLEELTAKISKLSALITALINKEG